MRPRLCVQVFSEDVRVILAERDGAHVGNNSEVGDFLIVLQALEVFRCDTCGFRVPPALIGRGALDEHVRERYDAGEHGGDE